MKRIISLLLCLALIAGLTAAVSAASVDTAAAGGDEVCVYVYLSADDAEYTFGVEYAPGSIVARPAEPGKEGLTFIDWYTDRACKNRFDFTQPIYEDVNLFGRFAPTEDVIGINVFDSPSADYPFYGYLLVKGDIAEYQNPPEIADDEEFFGWYTDRALTKEFDFSVPVYDYTYLFPKVVKSSDVCWAGLYLSADDPDPVTYFAIVKGELCPVPAEPGKDGLRFVGWYNDRALTKPMDFSKPCYDDFDLFAKWVEDSESVPFLLGDADGNGEVEVVDATLVQRYDAFMSVNYSNEQMMHADVNADGELDIIDSTFIQRYSALLKVPYAIGRLVYPE